MNTIHATATYQGHHWNRTPSDCATCRVAARKSAREWEERRGWRVRPIKGGGFQIERLVFWPLKVSRQLPDGRIWFKLETERFAASADACCWGMRHIEGSLT